MKCFGLSVFVLLLLLSAGNIKAQNVAFDIVTTFEKKFGVFHGHRRNHAKGICFTGFFKGINPYLPLSKASMIFDGNAYPIIGRFSHSGGNLHVSDTQHNGYGMAFQILLPDGQKHNITMNNLPFFPVPTPEAFLELQQITIPNPHTGKIDKDKITAFKILYPELERFNLAKSKAKSAGYNHVKYNSVNTFMITDAQGLSVPVRWEFVPQDQQNGLTETQLQHLGSNYLAQNLKNRIKKGNIVWDMEILIPSTHYPINNAAIPWESNHRFNIAKLEVTAVGEEQNDSCSNINFDPLVLSGQIKPSDDPILFVRSPTYAISFGKRLSEN